MKIAFFRNSFMVQIAFLIGISAYAQKAVKKRIDTLNYQIQFLDINTPNSDFSPAYYKDGIVFCSNRDRDFGVVYQSERTGLPLIDLYFTKSISGNNFKKPKPFSKIINSENSEGPVSFTKDFSKIYFTRNEVIEKESKIVIYTSSFQNEVWSEPLSLTLGSEKFSYGHPSISPQGAYLIFSANISGGFGGTDLYIVYLRDGKWGRPVNMGKPINSSANEITPFIHENGMLYFASDRKGGEGGFDIYLSLYSNLEWSKPSQMGYPINSTFNDFGLIIDDELNSGYFSSNRRNGEEDDDIYSFFREDDQFKNCDTLKKNLLCRTFSEAGSISSEIPTLVYEWVFGDGSKKRGNEVQHCYVKPGNYTVQLNVVDIISEQVLINEATYELKIDPIRSPYIESYDTLWIGESANFDASKSFVNGKTVNKYIWDHGMGEFLYGEKVQKDYAASGVYLVRLNLVLLDSNNRISNVCVQKYVNVMNQELKGNKDLLQTKVTDQDLKKVYNIKDSEGNIYKIQLATSDKSIKHKFKKYEGIVKVDEYYDRKMYGYTTGSFKSALEAYPKLKMIRKIGFKEAVLIAINNNKVVSGNDSSFFVPFDEKFIPVKVVNQTGKVTDKDGNPLQALINQENLVNGDKIDEIHCNEQGVYEMFFPDGELYGYSVFMKGYFPYSSNLDLREENSLSDIELNIIMYKANELVELLRPIKISNLFFAPERHEIQFESFGELDRIAAFIKESPFVQFEILGHTDNTGSPQYNLLLAQKRANEVANYLIKKGCKRTSLIPKGLGNTQPVTTDKKLIELNRRVEIKVKPYN